MGTIFTGSKSYLNLSFKDTFSRYFFFKFRFKSFTLRNQILF